MAVASVRSLVRVKVVAENLGGCSAGTGVVCVDTRILGSVGAEDSSDWRSSPCRAWQAVCRAELGIPLSRNFRHLMMMMIIMCALFHGLEQDKAYGS
jgi:hypothetical protein